jgi:hypothetical protein
MITYCARPTRAYRGRALREIEKVKVVRNLFLMSISKVVHSAINDDESVRHRCASAV